VKFGEEADIHAKIKLIEDPCQKSFLIFGGELGEFDS
jgi:hypothetical protein